MASSTPVLTKSCPLAASAAIAARRTVALCALAAFAWIAAPPASAQFIDSASMFEAGADSQAEPGLSDLGALARSGYQNARAAVEQSFLLATISERQITVSSGGSDTVLDRSVSLSVYMAARLCGLASAGAVEPFAADADTRLLYYSESWRLADGHSYIDSQTIPGANRKLDESALAGQDAPAWEAILFDGRMEHHWANSGRVAYSANLARPRGSGTKGDPCMSGSGDRFEKFAPFACHLRPPQHDARIEQEYLRVLDFCAVGRIDAQKNAEVVEGPRGQRSEIVFTSESPGDKFPKVDLLWRVDALTGLPLRREALFQVVPESAALFTTEWSSGVARNSDGRAVAVPVSTRSVEAKPGPGADATTATETRTLLLFAEFDEPAHASRRALSPDTLARWLGVALSWRNEDDCLVTSIPGNLSDGAGIPRCELLEKLRSSLKPGEWEYAWPATTELEPPQPEP